MRYSMYPESHAAHEAHAAAQEVGERPAYPEPLHTSRMPPPAGLVVPGPVASLTALALRFGWPARWTYATGHAPHRTTGAPGPLNMSFAVRLGQHPDSGNSGAAVYLAIVEKPLWKWDGIWVWGPSLLWSPHLDLAGFKAYVMTRGMVSQASMDVIRDIALSLALQAKERAKERAAELKHSTSARENGG